MSVIAFPTTLNIAKMTWGQHRNDVLFRSAFGSQAVANSQPVWKVGIEAPAMTDADAGSWKAWLMQVRGSTNQVSIWDMGRPVPVGTLRGSPTFSAAAAAGDTTIHINAGYSGAGKTLVSGDYLGFGSGTTQQVVMVVSPVTADVETRSLSLDFINQLYGAGAPGEFALTVEPPLRNAFTIGTAVVLDKPSALFRLQTQDPSWSYAPASIVSGFALDLIEDWRP